MDFAASVRNCYLKRPSIDSGDSGDCGDDSVLLSIDLSFRNRRLTARHNLLSYLIFSFLAPYQETGETLANFSWEEYQFLEGISFDTQLSTSFWDDHFVPSVALGEAVVLISSVKDSWI